MKYYTVIKTFFIDFYRTNLSVIAILVFLFFMYIIEGSFWDNFYNTYVNSSYTHSGIIAYIFCSLAMYQIISCNGKIDEITEDIELGAIDNLLIRPINYILYNLLAHIGMIFARVLIILPILYICLFYFGYPNIYIKIFLIIIFSLVCGILNGLLNISLSLLTFFYKESYGFIILKETLFWVLSGALIPLDILPHKIVILSKFLPFGYTLFYPLNAILINNGLIFDIFIKTLIWIVFLLFIVNLLWKFGLKKYQSGSE